MQVHCSGPWGLGLVWGALCSAVLDRGQRLVMLCRDTGAELLAVSRQDLFSFGEDMLCEEVDGSPRHSVQL